jgi:hypothetical protein
MDAEMDDGWGHENFDAKSSQRVRRCRISTCNRPHPAPRHSVPFAGFSRCVYPATKHGAERIADP